MSETARELIDRLDKWIAPQWDVKKLAERVEAVLALNLVNRSGAESYQDMGWNDCLRRVWALLDFGSTSEPKHPSKDYCVHCNAALARALVQRDVVIAARFDDARRYRETLNRISDVIRSCRLDAEPQNDEAPHD